MPFSMDAWQPVSSGSIDASGADYCALGHFHSILRGAGRKKLVYNAGSPEPLGFDEEGEHGVFIAAVSRQPSGESRIEAEFKRLSQRKYIKLEVRPEGCRTDEQLAAVIASSMRAAGGSEDLYGIVIRGIAEHSYKPDTVFITEQLEQFAFYVKITDQSSPDYDFRQIAAEPGLRGLFTRKMLERAAEASGTEEKELIFKALYYGIEAIDEGSVWL
jgi:DNA repair exonuclease SbcCD nuclease subunit